MYYAISILMTKVHCIKERGLIHTVKYEHGSVMCWDCFVFGVSEDFVKIEVHSTR